VHWRGGRSKAGKRRQPGTGTATVGSIPPPPLGTSWSLSHKGGKSSSVILDVALMPLLPAG
jgi:hypothetical protein